MLTARTELVSIRTTLYNQVPGLLKTFGVVLAPGKGGTFEQAVLLRCPGDALVRNAIEALLIAWRTAGKQKRKLELQLMRVARRSDTCRRMATIPGVGAITALTFITTIDNPNRFSRSTDVGAFLGLTPRRYQSGEVDLIDRISNSGDRMAQSLLFEAANALMRRAWQDSALRRWGLKFADRVGSRKAKVAVAVSSLSSCTASGWMEQSSNVRPRRDAEPISYLEPDAGRIIPKLLTH